MDTKHLESDISSHLVDFDWRLKAIFGTNTMVVHPPPPVIEVDFHLCKTMNCDEKLGNVTETFKLEMNISELKTLISSLEKSINNV